MSARNDRIDEAIRDIVRLRRAERLADSAVRREIRPVRQNLEALVGPTVSRARAARLLGVTQSALERWIVRGDVGTILTTAQSREVPLRELVDLVGQVEAARAGRARPLSAVLGERRKQAREAVDLDRLLPEIAAVGAAHGHRPAELRSLALHRLVAARLDERVIEEALERMRGWRARGSIHAWYADAWERILSLTIPEMTAQIGADSEHMRALRQASPFAGMLPEQERRLLLREIERKVA